jgi:hypothetical protein
MAAKRTSAKCVTKLSMKSKNKTVAAGVELRDISFMFKEKQNKHEYTFSQLNMSLLSNVQNM